MKGVKSPRKKSFFYVNFAFVAGFFGIGATICMGREIFCLPYAVLFFVFWLFVHNNLIKYAF